MLRRGNAWLGTVGATVTIEDGANGERLTYTIVGEHEADIKKRRISLVAPVARVDARTLASPSNTRPTVRGSSSVAPASRATKALRSQGF